MYKWCYTHSKMPTTSSGNTIEQIEFDKQETLKINFSEVTIFLCLLAYKLKANLLLDANCKEEEEGAWLKRPHEWVRTLLDKIMPAFD